MHDSVVPGVEQYQLLHLDAPNKARVTKALETHLPEYRSDLIKDGQFDLYQKYGHDHYLEHLNEIVIPPGSRTMALEIDPSKMRPGISEYSAQGRRRSQEDRAFIAQVRKSNQLDNSWTIGVFDGHVGDKTSQFLRETLVPALHERDFSANAYAHVDRLETARHGSDITPAGSTALTAQLKARPEDGSFTLTIHNVGDCRAMFVNANKIHSLTYDHNGTYLRDKDRRRVEQSGGFFYKQRVQGTHAVTRTFGDHGVKKHISTEPETYRYHIVPNTGDTSRDRKQIYRDEAAAIQSDFEAESDSHPERVIDMDADSNTVAALLFVSDGFTEPYVKASAEGAEKAIWQDVRALLANVKVDRSRNAAAQRDWCDAASKKMAKDLVDLAYAKGSKDNISVVVALLPCLDLPEYVEPSKGLRTLPSYMTGHVGGHNNALNGPALQISSPSAASLSNSWLSSWR